MEPVCIIDELDLDAVKVPRFVYHITSPLNTSKILSGGLKVDGTTALYDPGSPNVRAVTDLELDTIG